MQPVWNEPALAFDGPDGRWLACSELHIGFESGLARRGAYARSRAPEMAERLTGLLEAQAARRLLILGDVKDRVGGVSRQERRDVPAFFEHLADLDEVLIARGNHDVGLAGLLPKKDFPNVRIAPATGVLVEADDGPVAAMHGHAWPKLALLAADRWLVGHTHAAARLVDESGRSTTEWAWARGRLDAAKVEAKYGQRKAPEVIVFPPFNPFLGGAAVNRDGLLGPLGRLVDYERLRLVLLDGRDLGPVGTSH